jgi:capsular exopolysaccharide synthesis family protein
MDTAPTTETPAITLHFLDYWRVIRLRKSLILTVFLLCFITSSVLTYLLPKQYLSTVRIEVQKDNPEIDPTGNHAASAQGWDPYFLTTQFQIIKSWAILTEVITNLDLQHKLADQDEKGSPPWTMDRTYATLANRVTPDQTRGTSLIEISVKNPNPDLAATIANTVAEVYRERRTNSWAQDRNSGLESLESELTNNKAVLAVMQSNLSAMRTNLHITEIGDSLISAITIAPEAIREMEIRRLEAKVELNEQSNTLHNLQSIESTGGRAALEAALGTTLYRSLDPELGTKAEDVSRARQAFTMASKSGYGPNNPIYQAAIKDYEDATNAYEAKVTGIMSGLTSIVNHDQRVLDEIEAYEDKIKQDARDESITNAPYVGLKRDIENTQRVVDDLERKVIEERAVTKQPMRTVVVWDIARPDIRPISPKPLLIIPVGLIMGLIVGVGMAFFVEYLDTSVKTIDDVERSLQAPVLGVIPQNVGNLLDDGPESPHAEAYRVLRTNLLFARKSDDWNTITVLSGGAGEGKTTTLFNLAIVFAQNGQKTLVVDSDLRRPSVHRMLRANNAMGLTDLLLNKQMTPDQVIVKTKLPTLDFLPSGKLPSSSMSILGSAQMKEIIAQLKARYDFIFFDSPPLLGVSDASILASEMDMVLQVIQYRRYPQPMTLRAKQMIQKVGGNLMGLVLNNINMSQDENYYYYSGYYEYEYRSPKNEPTVVQLSDAAAKAAKVDIKQKY